MIIWHESQFDYRVSGHFKISEFKCNCGCGYAIMNPEFISKLQKLRDKVGYALHVSSGYRCPRHNRSVKGGLHSRHLIGRAADIFHSPNIDFSLLTAVYLELGFTGVGNGDGFVHLDDDPTRKQFTIWNY